MNQPDRVAVICGGQSAEREISLKSGKSVMDALDSAPCEVKMFDTSRDLGERLIRENIDVAFIALHGRGGEDGTVQALLDWYGVPYTGPGPSASALCMDKIRSKQVFEQIGVRTPRWYRIRSGEKIENKRDFETMVVKPRMEGSSIGMSIVEAGDLKSAVQKARQYDQEVIVEEYIEGYEVTVGVVTLDSVKILPPVGINPSHDFFDFDTKYTKGLTEYDVPARLSEDRVLQVQEISREVVSETKTEQLARLDFIFTDPGDFFLLEVNTIPGFTETSLLPKAASEAGISFERLTWNMVCQAGEQKIWDVA